MLAAARRGLRTMSAAGGPATIAGSVTAAKGGGVHVHVHVKPNARSDGVAWSTERIEVRSMEQPREGAANDDVVRQLAKALGVGKSALAVVRGHKDRDKTVLVTGLPLADVLARVTAAASADG